MPKVVFEKMSLEDNINFVKEILNDKDGILDTHTYTINLFPELQEISLDSPQEIIDKKISEIVTKYYNNYDKFEDDINRYSNVWEKYNDSFFDKLTNYLNTSWPVEHNIIHVTVGIIPVCPRYLDNSSFSVHVGISNDQLIETCAHELCHFLWFKKWKELYPNSNPEDFESPHIIWEYSEMVVDPILNSKIMTSVLKRNSRYSYDSFYEIYDEKEKMMDKLFNIYNQDIDIEHKISEGFDYISTLITSKKVSNR